MTSIQPDNQIQQTTLPKRLLLAITKSNWGGAQKYVYEIALGMRDRGYDVTVATGGNGELCTRLRNASIHIEDLGNAQRNIHIGKDFTTLLDLIKLIKRTRPYIIHINSSKIGGLGTFAARILRVPKIVFTLHGLAFNEDRSSISKYAVKFFTWLTIMFSHQTIAVSEGMRNQISEWPFVSKKITVVRNALIPLSPLPSHVARTELIGTRTFSTLIGSIAELHHIKGIEYMLRALSRLKKEYGWDSVGYVVMGEGEDRARLESLISELQLQDSVILAGHVADASTYLSALDIFVMPSISEGLAYALLEAAAEGKPCIVSNVGGLPEVIEHNTTGQLVPARSVEALMLALRRFVEDPEFAKECGERAKQFVTDHFSHDGMIDGTASVYARDIYIAR